MSRTAPAGYERVIWRGRAGADPASHVLLEGALDGWSCDRAELSLLLAGAGELVVLDALSFPWEQLSDTDRDIPLVLALPEQLDAAGVRTVLDKPVLRHLTHHDVLLDPRAEVREQIGAAYRLRPEQWLVPADHSVGAACDAVVEWGARRLIRVPTPFGEFWSLEGDLITGHLAEYGAHQRGTLNALLGLLDDDLVVWDVGAHIGTLLVPLLASGKVASGLAIEADHDTAAILRRNLVDNGYGEDIEILEALLHDPAGPAGGFSPARFPGNSGATTFLPAPGRGAGRARDRRARTVGPTLDDLRAERPAPSLVKIDVEGAEVGVLRGAEGVLATDRPVLLVEVAAHQLIRQGSSVDELDALLDRHGYALLRVAGERHLRGPDYAIEPIEHLASVADELFDVLAVPRESALAQTPEGAASAEDDEPAPGVFPAADQGASIDRVGEAS